MIRREGGLGWCQAVVRGCTHVGAATSADGWSNRGLPRQHQRESAGVRASGEALAGSCSCCLVDQRVVCDERGSGGGDDGGTSEG